MLDLYPNWQERIHGNPNWWDELVKRYNPEEAHEEYLEEAIVVSADDSGRVTMSVEEAAAMEFVDGMVSNDTQELH